MADTKRVEAAVAAAEKSLRMCGPGARAISEAIAAALKVYDEYDDGECRACNCTDCRRDRSRGRNAR